MLCPFCNSDNDRVVDSRSCEEGGAIRRRRECASCRRRYTTYERIEEPVIRVLKKDGTLTPFHREKLRSGIVKACCKRPVRDEQLADIVTAIETQIFDRPDQLIESREIGELVLEHLKRLDEVAYLRFASVYRDFTTAEDFVQELDPNSDHRRRSPR